MPLLQYIHLPGVILQSNCETVFAVQLHQILSLV
jgi:hypothetical protein